MKLAILALRVLVRMFGQDTLWEAFKEVAERRTTIKLAKFEEQEEIRRLKNEMKENRLRKKKERREDKQGGNRTD